MAKIFYKYGTMGSKKTADAIMVAFDYEQKGMSPLCIGMKIDNREDVGYWWSRIGLKRKVDFVVDADTDIYETVLAQLKLHEKWVDVVIIDECQFLTREQVYQLACIADVMNIPVICYGLRTDFRGYLFEGSATLFALADSVEEIKSMASDGTKATMNARFDGAGNIIRDGEQILIGGNEIYKPLSRKQFFSEFTKELQKEFDKLYK